MSKQHLNEQTINDSSESKPVGRLLALDLGEKRIGVAVSDELRLTARPLQPLRRTSWKRLLISVAELLGEFDAVGLVIGLPLNMDGTESSASEQARQLARNFKLSLSVPVHLQDERLTSREAEASLREAGISERELLEKIDSEAAAFILRDFLAGEH